MPHQPQHVASFADDVEGRTFALAGCVGTAWHISKGYMYERVTVREIYSGRSWEERWGNKGEGLRGRIERGELVLVQEVEQ